MSEEGSSEVSVVFVTYNSAGVIGKAVASVPEACEVIVIDNASPEGTPWREDLAGRARVMVMARNLGFGRACNAGARAATRRFVLFLNPDAVLDEGALERLVAAARAYGQPAILMPAIHAEDGRLMRKERSVVDRIRVRARLKPEEVAGDYCTRFVHGAAFMVGRREFFELGGFDEAIFLYHEDDDLAARAVARHVPIIVVPAATARHLGGKSSAPSLGQTFRVNRFKQQSERYVLAKYGMARPRALSALKLAGGCALAALLLDRHRLMIRAGKLAGLFDKMPTAPGDGSGGETLGRART